MGDKTMETRLKNLSLEHKTKGSGKFRICNEDWLKKDIRIVLIGKTGRGKSATGNTILGKDVFLSTVSGSSVTDKCSPKHSYRFGKKFLVVDTPCIFDTPPKKEDKNKDIQKEIERCIDITSPGPHAFILVSNTIRYSEEENNSALHFVNHFGENIYRYFIILFTRKDDLDAEGKTLMEHIKTVPPQLKKVIKMSGDRVIAFNNRLKGEESDAQVVELLSMILGNIKSNGGECYTNKMYLQAERGIKESEEGDLKMEREERDKKFKETERNVSEKFKVELERERYQSDKREHLQEIVRNHQQETDEPQNLADQIKELKKKLEDSNRENEALRQALKKLQIAESSKAAEIEELQKIIQDVEKQREEEGICAEI